MDYFILNFFFTSEHGICIEYILHSTVYTMHQKQQQTHLIYGGFLITLWLLG